MILPINYIIHQLSSLFPHAEAPDKESLFLVKRPVFYNGEKRLKSKQLYLANSNDLPDDLTIDVGAFLFYCGKKKVLPAANCYHLPDPKTLFAVCNILHQLFDDAQQWQQHLSEMVNGGATLNDVLSEASMYLPHPIGIMNPHFRIIAEYQPPAYTEVDPNLKNGYLNADIVNSLKSDSYYNAVEQYQKPFLYSASGIEERYLCVNLFRRNVFAGRINVREACGKINSWEPHFLDILKECILPLYLRYLDKEKSDDQHRSFIQSLLQGTINSESDMYSFLQEVQWQQTDTFICISFGMSDEDYENQTINYFTKELERNFKDTFCVPFGNEIIMLVHLADALKSLSELDEQLSYFIRESNFRMGTSHVFYTLSEASFARQQAQIALQYGLREKPYQWKHAFDDYVLTYLRDKCLESLPAEYVCSPALLSLLQRDRQNGSDLYHTLKCYLEHNSNVVQTAKALFIHRGTLIYRLEKITEITGIDLTDWTQQTYLSVSYQLLGK